MEVGREIKLPLASGNQVYINFSVPPNKDDIETLTKLWEILKQGFIRPEENSEPKKKK
jgi:hypothetical protein